MLAERAYRSVALVVGEHSFRASDAYRPLLAALSEAGVAVIEPSSLARGGDRFEASPDVVDAAAADLTDDHVDAVVAVGGGATVDLGKALSAALCMPGSIADYLEGVGTKQPSGEKVPFVAVPTSAGTGSEATKNAVLSKPGEGGFKKSLRHDAYVPDRAVIDPVLQLGCPRSVTAASGMDAITQLLEAYLSTSASSFTDALALDGLRHAGRSFARVVERGDTDVDARGGMAYAAYLSGVCLANAGLGAVHGIAGPIGAVRRVPHGVACGLLLPPVVRRIAAAADRDPLGAALRAKLAGAAQALTGRTPANVETGSEMLLARLDEFAGIAALPRLSAYGMGPVDVDEALSSAGNKNSPISFSAEDRREMVLECL